MGCSFSINFCIYNNIAEIPLFMGTKTFEKQKILNPRQQIFSPS